MTWYLISGERRTGRTHANILSAVVLLREGTWRTVYFGKHQLRMMDLAIESGIQPSQIRYGNEGTWAQMSMAIADWMLDEYMSQPVTAEDIKADLRTLSGQSNGGE